MEGILCSNETRFLSYVPFGAGRPLRAQLRRSCLRRGIREDSPEGTPPGVPAGCQLAWQCLVQKSLAFLELPISRKCLKKGKSRNFRLEIYFQISQKSAIKVIPWMSNFVKKIKKIKTKNHPPGLRPDCKLFFFLWARFFELRMILGAINQFTDR